MSDFTTIAVDRDTHEQLSKYKIYDDETFNDAVERLLRFDREQR